MQRWMKKLHMWAGLLTFTAFVVWGAIGVHGAFTPAPGEFVPPDVSAVKEFPFPSKGDLGDKELARAIFEAADIPLRGGHYNVHRDEDQNLAFFVFTANGRHELTYFEETETVRMAIRRAPLLGFLSTMHTAHSRRGPQTAAARAWANYNELSTWAFFFMTVSGVYLWLATRPNINWARWTFGVAVVGSVILYWAGR